MQHLMNFKKNVHIFLLAFAIGFITMPHPVSAASSIVEVASYYDVNFGSRSAIEPITLQMDCDAISFAAVCQDDAKDTVICHIIDKSHGGIYSATLPFNANGMDSGTTISCSFPAGKYDIYFTGSSDILKLKAVAMFVAQK